MKTALLVLFRSMLLPMNYHYAYSTIPMKHTQVALTIAITIWYKTLHTQLKKNIYLKVFLKCLVFCL